MWGAGEVDRGFTEESPQIGLEGRIRVIVSPSIRLPSQRHPEELAMLVMDAQRNVCRLPEGLLGSFFPAVGFTPTSDQVVDTGTLKGNSAAHP